MSNREYSLELILLSDARVSSSPQTPAVFAFPVASLETTVTFRSRKNQNVLSQNTAEVCNFELALWKQELKSFKALIIDTHTMSKWGASKEVTVIQNSHFCLLYKSQQAYDGNRGSRRPRNGNCTVQKLGNVSRVLWLWFHGCN